MNKLYEVNGKLFWYDPKDPNLPKSAKLVKKEKPEAAEEKPEAEPKPKPKAKAVKPANKAVKAENK